MKRLNIIKVIDQWGWSYDFIGREQKKYSKHNIIIKKYDDINLDNIDIVFLHGTNISPNITNDLPLVAKEKGIKVIGSYNGDPAFWGDITPRTYAHCDLIVTISPETYRFAKQANPGVPVVFLPESIDTNFFVKEQLSPGTFNVGWAGSNLALKRQEILDRLKFDVIKQAKWGQKFFKKNRSLSDMVNFYHALNVFVLTSETECMPRVILEAMSCGRPIISTSVGNIPFLLDEEWIVPVHPKSEVISQMNRKLEKLQENFKLQRNVAYRNRKFIEDNFSWEKNQPMWDKVFSLLVKDKIPAIIKECEKYLDMLDPNRKYFYNRGINVKSPKIVYVIPGTGISGGIAVILQHVNRLKKRGYDVYLLSQDNKNRITWFKNNVTIIPQNTKYTHLFNDIDVLVLTGWDTVKITDHIKAKRTVYFVQSDERRFTDDVVTKRLMHATYKNNFEYMTEAKWIQRWLKQEFNHDAYYVPNGLDKELFYKTNSIENKKRKTRVLLEGPINIPFKGVKEAYNAVKDLNCDIWIVSSGGNPNPLWKYDRFFEKIPMHKMREIYSSCDIMVKLSRVEGFFGPPMEAMACGCAVVAGKCTGSDEYIVNRRNALVVNPTNIDQVRNAVKELMVDRKFKDKLVRNGFETVKKWHWEDSISYLEKMIDKKEIEVFYSEKKPHVYDYKIERMLIGEKDREITRFETVKEAVKEVIEEPEIVEEIIEEEPEEKLKEIEPIVIKEPEIVEEIVEEEIIEEETCDIIVVSYNTPELLKKCINSIRKYTEFSYKLIIVDNNSDSKTIEYLKSIEGFAKIIYNKKNYGFGYANNQALLKFDSDYVCFLNSDTIVTEKWLTKLIDALEKKEAGMVGPVTNFVSSEIQEVKFDSLKDLDENDPLLQDFAKNIFKEHSNESIVTHRLVGFCLLTKREILNQSGYFDDRYEIGNFEDDDLCFRIIQRGYKLYCVNSVFIYHYGGKSFDKDKSTKVSSSLARNFEIFKDRWYESGNVRKVSETVKPLTINYILASDTNAGGVKVVFEHANRLMMRGHNVNIICGNNETDCNWFNINVPVIYNYSYEDMPPADIVVGTYFTTLEFLKKCTANVKIHLCQGYESLIYDDGRILKTIEDHYKMVKNKIVVSQWLKEILDRKYDEMFNIGCVPNGIDQYVFSFKKHERNKIPRILITGSENLPIKGVKEALEATKRIAKHTNIEIVRLSPDEQIDLIFECEFHVMGKMTQDEIAKVYESCDITVCASYKVEGFSLHPLESMASGTPVVTTDNGGVMEYAVNNENAIIIPAKNSLAIENGIKALLDDTALYNKLAENGIKTSRKYLWYKQIDKLENFYYNIHRETLLGFKEKLSVCMIVKNEEENLERCLNSIKDIASEIIVVDTGSIDNTVHIAREFGVKIFHYEWNNNFSDARNFSISKATQPWILLLDADEMIAKKDLWKLKEIIAGDQCAYNIETRNYVNSKNIEGFILCEEEYPEEEKNYKGWCSSPKVRLFPNISGIKFEGDVHELVEDSITRLGFTIRTSDIAVHHYGYLNRTKEKDEIYAELGKKKLEKNKNDEKSLFELAEQYMALNNYDEALVMLRRLLQISSGNYIYLAKMGTAYNLLQEYDRAEELFKKSLKIKENEYAFKHLGICYAGKKDFQSAYDVFKDIAYITTDLKTMGDFAYCCNTIGKFDESIIILEKAFKLNKKEVQSWGLLEIAYNKKGIELADKHQYKKALLLFKSALRLNPDAKDVQTNIKQINSILQSKRKSFSKSL